MQIVCFAFAFVFWAIAAVAWQTPIEAYRVRFVALGLMFAIIPFLWTAAFAH